MSREKQKVLSIMQNLDRDYKAGKISPQKYKYFKAKYQQQLNDLDKFEATNRIRSMQGKRPPNINNRKKARKKKTDRRKEEKDLVQKYIVNPKKEDKDFNKKKSGNSGTYKLLVVLTLVIAFTIGISVGIFALDFDDLSVVNADAIVVDTSFPTTENITGDAKNNSTNTTTTTSVSQQSTEDNYVSNENAGNYAPGENTGGGASSSQGSSTSGGDSGGGGAEAPLTT